MRIESAELTFLNIPMKQPELWAWGLRNGYTVGLVEVHTDAGITGIGEVVVCMGPDAGVIQAIFDQMKHAYIGERPFDTERVVAKIMSAGWYSFERTAGREAIGPGTRLRVDANEVWSPSTAIRILSKMQPASLEYVEQPVLMHDIVGLAHVRRHSGVPVAANQSAWGRHAILDIIRREAADVIMTDPHQEGGLDGDEKDSRHVRSRRARFRQSRLQCHDREHDQPHARYGDVIGLHPGAAGPSRLSRGRLRDRAN
jgi:L-alanine-DL-glutamate epimerase and related enzymes of enolase superfamily